jgi:hypothetical protein
MTDTTTPREWPRCERCGGQVHRDSEGMLTCLWCGELRFPAGQAQRGAAEAYGVRLKRPLGQRPH